jgi:hypothetical protein
MRNSIRLVSAGGVLRSTPDKWAGPERRREKRRAVLRRVALLHSAGLNDICVVRNMSAGGLSARVFTRLAIGEPVQVELRRGELLRGSVVWGRELDVGISLAERLRVDAVLACRWATEIGRARNLPRTRATCEGRIETASGHWDATLRDISPAGAKLKTEAAVEQAGDVILRLPGLPPVAGVVRWTSGGEVGLSFHEHIPSETFARWIRAGGKGDGQAGTPDAACPP